MIPTHLYVDNFRGFRDTLLTFVGTNFLVGENSTGKTSILSLITLFSDPDFWKEQNFGTSTPFGHFDEIVSSNSPDRSYFRLGIITYVKSDDRKNNANGFLFTFRNRSGLPQLTDFSTRQGNNDVTFKLHGTRMYVKSVPAEYEFIPDAVLGRLRGDWLQRHVKGIEGYDQFSERMGASAKSKFGIPLSFLLSVLREADEGQKLPSSFGNPIFDAMFDSGKVVALAPVRSKPRRTYDEVNREFSPEGDHTPYLLRDLLGSRKSGASFRGILETLGQESRLFDAIKINKLGKTSTAPFEVDIVLDGRPLTISNVGYGVSQAMPIIVEVLNSSGINCFAIQQPEVHLHPRAQAALGDLLFGAATAGNVLAIETHSDFLIDRFRVNYRNHADRVNLPKSQILFFERKNGSNIVTEIPISSTGDISSDQPASYREFFFEEDLKLLNI